MLPDSVLPTPEDDIARMLGNLEKRVSHLEALEKSLGWSLIEEIELSASVATIDFQNIPSSFRHLKLIGNLRTDRVGVDSDVTDLRFNNDAGANYYWQRLFGSAGAAGASEVLATTEIVVGFPPTSVATAERFGLHEILIPYYAKTDFDKNALAGMGGFRTNAGATGPIFKFAGTWDDTSAIDRITLLPGVGPNFVADSRMSLYGIN